MINSVLEMQAKSIDELLCRLIKERDGKKLDTTSVNPSSSTCTVSFTQTNPHTSDASVSGTSMPNSSTQSVNRFHSRTTIDGSAPTFGVPQQTTTNMCGQGYTQITPSFSMSNFTLALTPLGTTAASGNYQAPYITIAYTDSIQLPDSSLGFLPNHTY
jgi:hypothetical protein